MIILFIIIYNILITDDYYCIEIKLNNKNFGSVK